jgi:hypothetical protein
MGLNRKCPICNEGVYYMDGISEENYCLLERLLKAKDDLLNNVRREVDHDKGSEKSD